jgi:hypothetical protein
VLIIMGASLPGSPLTTKAFVSWFWGLVIIQHAMRDRPSLNAFPLLSSGMPR